MTHLTLWTAKLQSAQTVLVQPRHFFGPKFLHFLSNFKLKEGKTSWLDRASKILNPFYYQLMHITLKNAELLKHSKLDKKAPTCFGLHRNHLQGAKVSAWLKNYRFG